MVVIETILGQELNVIEFTQAFTAYELAIFSPNFFKIDHLVPSGFVAVMGLYYSPPVNIGLTRRQMMVK